MYIQDVTKLVIAMNRFYAYVQSADYASTGVLRETISFTDPSCLLGREEDYKHAAAINGRNALQVEDWKKNWIGTGKIAERAAKAIGKAENLVNRNQQIDFKNRLNSNHPKFEPSAEEVLYDIYCGANPEASFARAIDTFGAKYDTIAFLFFMKSYEQFLPISPGNFDRVFESLGIDFATKFRCNWENYNTFVAIIREVQEIMNRILPLESPARLIDAHSFLWFINEERFKNWEPGAEIRSQIELRTEGSLTGLSGVSPQKTLRSSLAYNRNAQVVRETRVRAGKKCQLCGNDAPFNDKHNNPYLEVHHVIWLSRGGVDDVSNTVALCPNCHTKMHVVDDPADIEFLRSVTEFRK